MKKLTTLGALLASSSVFATDGLKIGGFVDGAYKSAGKTTAEAASSTFFLHDAALYMGKTMGMGEVMIDIPVNNSGTGNSFTLANTKAQAYVNWKYDNGFNWRLGQFDTLYGYEANDSADRVFAVAGNVFSKFMPYTHTGLKVGYEMSDALGFDLLIANRADKGLRVVSQNPLDWGFKLSTKSDTFTAAVGGLFYKNLMANTEMKMGWLFNVMAETKADMLTFAIDVALRKASVASTNTNAKSEMGIMGLVDFELAENIAWGLRPEWIQTYADNADTSLADTKKGTELKVTTGPSFKMSKDFTVRSEYTFSNAKAGTTGAKGTTHHDFVLSAVHRF